MKTTRFSDFEPNDKSLFKMKTQRFSDFEPNDQSFFKVPNDGIIYTIRTTLRIILAIFITAYGLGYIYGLFEKLQ